MNVNILLVVHATLGFIAISSFFIILFRNKGDTIHKYLGYALIVAVVGAALAGTVVAISVDKLYFINIGIAAVLQIAIGLLVLSNKKFLPRKSEIVIISLLIITSLLFFTYSNSIAYTLGTIYLSIGLYQVYLYSGKKEVTKLLWLAQHIGHMLGSGISVITAFIVGNIGDYAIIGFIWAVPAILGVLLVRYFRLKYAPDRHLTIGKLKW